MNSSWVNRNLINGLLVIILFKANSTLLDPRKIGASLKRNRPKLLRIRKASSTVPNAKMLDWIQVKLRERTNPLTSSMHLYTAKSRAAATMRIPLNTTSSLRLLIDYGLIVMFHQSFEDKIPS